MKYVSLVLLFSVTLFAQISPNFPYFQITVDSNVSPGQIFFAPFYRNSGPSNPPFAAIMNDDGSLFSAKQLDSRVFDFKMQPNGNYTYFDTNLGGFYETDMNYNIIDSFFIKNGYITDPHELRILPNGNALLLGQDYEPVDMSQIVTGGKTNARVIGCVLQELDQNKNVIFQWNSFDHYKITDAMRDINLLDTLIDYVHGNSIDIDNDGNFLLSARHLDEVTKINSSTGDIIWRLGGKNNQFYFTNDTIGFSHQHYVRRIANGDITMFDNGNLHNPQFSRAVEYKVDDVNKTATLVWEYRNNPVTYTSAMGSVQRLDNGNTLIGWGENQTNYIQISEITSTGDIAFELQLPYDWSYRAFRFNVTPTSVKQNTQVANNYTLSQNYPNPFNPSTVIKYSISTESEVNLKVYNTIGEKVKDLVTGIKQPGNYSVNFNGSNLPSGVYFYSLTVQPANGNQGFHSVKKMLLLK